MTLSLLITHSSIQKTYTIAITGKNTALFNYVGWNNGIFFLVHSVHSLTDPDNIVCFFLLFLICVFKVFCIFYFYRLREADLIEI